MWAQGIGADEGVARYAATTDYCKIFAEEMQSLYLLAFLLTADKEKAEKCFVGGLGECIERIGLLMDEGRSWARRVIVKHAIWMIRPVPEDGAEGFVISTQSPAIVGTSNRSAAIISLCAFDRFVFVMSVLERQSDEDCTSLLRCSRQEIVMAREVALRLIAAVNPGWEQPEVESILGRGFGIDRNANKVKA